MILAAVDWLHYLFIIPLALISVFLTLVILVQRGRGGGLTGALGGMGGQSAFGTKAGDLFTKITIAVAFVWIVLAMASLKFLNDRSPFNASARGTAGQSGSGNAKSGDKTSGDAKSGEKLSGGTSGSGSSTAPPSGTTAPPNKSGGASSAAPAPTGGSTDSGAKPSKPAKTTP